jgi:hypothetical protein
LGDEVTWRARHVGLPWVMTNFRAPIGPIGAAAEKLVLVSR